MKQEECVESFKQMLGEALLLGMKLSDSSYDGLLLDEKNHPIRDAIEKLHQSTREFLAVSSLESISAEQIFPLHEEIQHISQTQD